MADPTAGQPAAATSGARFQRLNRRIAQRYGSIIVPPAAALLVIIGTGITVAPNRYTSGSYRVAFQLCPARGIGILFVVTGTAALALPCWWGTLAALVAVHITWGLVVTFSSISRPGVSPTAFAYPTFVAWVLFCSVAGMDYRGRDR
jgi:hypothetical protein